MVMCWCIFLCFCYEFLFYDSRLLYCDCEVVEVFDCYDYKKNFVCNICSLVYFDSYSVFVIILDLFCYFVGK